MYLKFVPSYGSKDRNDIRKLVQINWVIFFYNPVPIFLSFCIYILNEYVYCEWMQKFYKWK